MQIETTKKTKKSYFIPPITLKETDIEQELYIQIPSSPFMKKLIDHKSSPQDFITPMRFPAQQHQKDKDGFFVPLSRAPKTAKNVTQCFQSEHVQLQLQDLRVLDEIGMGSSGHVQRAIHIPTNTTVALKNIQIIAEDAFTKQVNFELQTLVNCDNPNIIKCYGAFLQGSQITIALEYMNIGTLQDLLKKYGRIPQVMLGQIAYQVLKGLEYLHKVKKIIHRDIKPSNLLINSEGEVKIADFGVSGQLMNSKDQRSTWIGTITYMSPERFRGEPYSSDTDIWSLGLTLLECAWGQFPYPYPYMNDSKQLGFWEVMEFVSSKPAPQVPSDYSQEMNDFIQICLNKEGGTRSTPSELLKHPVIRQYEGVSLMFLKNWLNS